MQPEKADTYTLGAVFTPMFAPGLSLSVDWYDIKHQRGDQPGRQSGSCQPLLQAGDPTFCDLITLDPGTDRIILIGDVYVNVAQAEVSGVDVELSYGTDTNLFGHGDESLSARLFASWLTKRSETDFAGNTIDFAGQTGRTPVRRVLFRLSGLQGDRQPHLPGRPVGPLPAGTATSGTGKQDLTPTNILADNTVSSVFYTDMNLSYTLPIEAVETQLFAERHQYVRLASPPVTPCYSAFTGASTQSTRGLYDVLGRRYTVGVKIKL